MLRFTLVRSANTGLAIVVGTLLAFSGCASSEDDPVAECGDGIVDPGEDCDDGNTASGDGCSSTCVNEAGAECGNDVLELGEECDDGNTTAGDGCSATCQDEPECGNGDVEAGEECDDGNTTSGDGCSATCQDEGGGAVCGNGVRELGEECDDGNTTSGDGCSATCQLESTDPFCGNGVVEAGEECDDGNTTSGDGCDASCQLEAGTCGDGVLNVGEECDDGNMVAGDGCDATCNLEGPICGNGDVEAGEECDDGNTMNFDGCSSACRIEVCGDGIVQPDEECDDGNTIDGDGCDAFCFAELVPECGNGVLETGEECDDGNTTSGDGCASDCTLEATGVCTPEWELFCGGTDSWNTTFSGSTDTIDSYACVGWDESGREYTYSFVAPTASNVVLTLSGTTADLDLFVLSNGSGCDESGCLDYGDSTVSFLAVPGETYYIVVDGYIGAEGPYSLSLTCGECGDGNLDPDEACDDGNTAGGDGCSATCALEGCGNDVLDVGEACDDGDTLDCDGCSATCQIEECGNFVVECAETCDDGGTLDGDGCSSTCQIEGGMCTPDFTIMCGDSDSYSTLFGGSTDVIDAYSCVSWDETGREYAYEFIAPITGDVTVTLSGIDVDLDIFVVADAAGSCQSTNCLAYGSTSATFAATVGETYYFIVDGYLGVEGVYTLDVSCGGGFCGDGLVQAGEQCDDGDTVSGDGCSSTCQDEFCGDGVVQAGLGEECDDGNNLSGDGCSETCQDEAGACIPDLLLSCGGIDTWDTTLAGSTDMVDSYGCVGWDESGPEYAYEFIAPSDTLITATLSGLGGTDLDVFIVEDLGDGSCDPEFACRAFGDNSASFDVVTGRRYFIVVDGFEGASGAYTLELTCEATTSCGDGALEPGEECDDGNTSGGDGCSATCLLEAGTCEADFPASCGMSDSWSTLGLGATDFVDEYSCIAWDESGPEYTYVFTAPADGPVTIDLTAEAGVDLDVFVLLEVGGGCVAGNCVAYGGTSATFTASAGTTYYVVVDGYAGDAGSYVLDISCGSPVAE